MKVIKRDGSTEEFDPFKIARVVTAAGLNAKQAQELAAKVDQRLKSLGQDSVSSLVIGEYVQDELKIVDEYAYNMFVWYQGIKKRDGEKEKSS